MAGWTEGVCYDIDQCQQQRAAAIDECKTACRWCDCIRHLGFSFGNVLCAGIDQPGELADDCDEHVVEWWHWHLYRFSGTNFRATVLPIAEIELSYFGIFFGRVKKVGSSLPWIDHGSILRVIKHSEKIYFHENGPAKIFETCERAIW